jgi:hypothetical protein
MNLTFEPTVTWGTIFQTIALVAAIVVGWFRVKADIMIIKSDVQGLQSASDNFTKALEQLGSVLTQVAVQDNRILNIEKRLDELAHGKGFVT